MRVRDGEHQKAVVPHYGAEGRQEPSWVGEVLERLPDKHNVEIRPEAEGGEVLDVAHHEIRDSPLAQELDRRLIHVYPAQAAGISAQDKVEKCGVFEMLASVRRVGASQVQHRTALANLAKEFSAVPSFFDKVLRGNEVIHPLTSRSPRGG